MNLQNVSLLQKYMMSKEQHYFGHKIMWTLGIVHKAAK